MTEQEIVLETIEYYRTHKRANDDGSCFYLTEDGDMRAVGRCMQNPPVDVRGSVKVLLLFHGDVMFKEQYRGQSAQFWHALQRLHDVDRCWVKNKDGGQDLTEHGKSYCKDYFGVVV